MSSSWVGVLLLFLALLAAPGAATEDERPCGNEACEEPSCSGERCSSASDESASAEGNATASASAPAASVHAYASYSSRRPCNYYDIDPHNPRLTLWPHILGVVTINTNCINVYTQGP